MLLPFSGNVPIQNQFFISGLSGDEIIQNRVLDALYKRILLAYKENKCFRVIIVIPLLPGYQGGLDDSGAASVRAIMHWQYRTICRGQNSILHNLNALLGQKASDYISFCGLRTYGQLSDSCPLVTSQVLSMKHSHKNMCMFKLVKSILLIKIHFPFGSDVVFLFFLSTTFSTY
nr:phospholipase D zeta 1-like isoform X2 [Ipomoea batatas]